METISKVQRTMRHLQKTQQGLIPSNKPETESFDQRKMPMVEVP
jgi:hypothetical protein